MSEGFLQLAGFQGGGKSAISSSSVARTLPRGGGSFNFDVEVRAVGAELFNASVTGRVFANGEMTSLNGDGSLRLKQSLVRLEVSSCSIDATGARTSVIMDFLSASATLTAE